MLQSTYGECDLEKEKVVGSGWFTEDPREIQQRLELEYHLISYNQINHFLLRFSCRWKTANFSAGDVLIFTNRTIHMSTKNTTNKYGDMAPMFISPYLHVM